jgi:segregation and condensation protein A
MEITSLLSCEIRQPFGAGLKDQKPGRGAGKVVMISSHAGWPARHELRDDEGGECEIVADTVHLTRVFHEVLERLRQGPVLNMEDDPITIGQMIDHLWRRFSVEDAPIRLNQLLRDARSERAVICMFLALLELVRLQAILLRQDRSFADILMKRNSALGS